MGTWIASNWVGLAALLVTLIGIPIAVLATRKWGNRRARLQVLMDSTGLLVAGEMKDKLQVTYEGTPVADPHLVTLSIKNIGPRDIKRENFDGERPLMFDLNSELYGMVGIGSSDESEPNILALTQTENGAIGVRASHIPKGTEWWMKFMVSGNVLPDLRGRLIDTDIVHGEPTSRTFLRILGSNITVSLSPLSLPQIGSITIKRK